MASHAVPHNTAHVLLELVVMGVVGMGMVGMGVEVMVGDLNGRASD